MLLLCLLASGCKSKRAPTKEASKPAAGDAAVAAAPASLEGELAAIRDKYELPAVGVAAWRDGKLIAKHVVGVRKAGDATKVTPDDKWHLGSNGKAMTALLVGIFVGRKVISWTDTIGAVFAGDKIDPGYENVTLKQLLHHEGGLPEPPPDELWKQLWADGAAPGARLTFVRAILARKPAEDVGSFNYSNASYMIAAAMLEAKTGKRWEELIRSELFDKLGMASCGFGAPGSKSVIDQPWGHDPGGTPIAPGPAGDNPPGVGPAGTVHCTLDDYGRFLNVFATGAPALVTPDTMKRLTTGSDDGYAGGWMTIEAPTGGMLVHSGSNTLWYATTIVGPAKKLAFTVVTNKGDGTIENHLEALLRLLPR